MNIYMNMDVYMDMNMEMDMCMDTDLDVDMDMDTIIDIDMDRHRQQTWTKTSKIYLKIVYIETLFSN
jgi:hypothetical protein